MRIFCDKVIFVVDIEGYFGSVEVLNTQVLKLEIEGLLPNRIVGFLTNLSNGFHTAVFRVCPRISISTKPSTADFLRSNKLNSFAS